MFTVLLLFPLALAGACSGRALSVGANCEGVAEAGLLGRSVCTIRSWPEDEGSLRRSATAGEEPGLPEPDRAARGAVDVTPAEAPGCEDGNVLPASSALGASSLRAASGTLIWSPPGVTAAPAAGACTGPPKAGAGIRVTAKAFGAPAGGETTPAAAGRLELRPGCGVTVPVPGGGTRVGPNRKGSAGAAGFSAWQPASANSATSSSVGRVIRETPFTLDEPRRSFEGSVD
jgi:hypothetical protein